MHINVCVHNLWFACMCMYMYMHVYMLVHLCSQLSSSFLYMIYSTAYCVSNLYALLNDYIVIKKCPAASSISKVINADWPMKTIRVYTCRTMFPKTFCWAGIVCVHVFYVVHVHACTCTYMYKRVVYNTMPWKFISYSHIYLNCIYTYIKNIAIFISAIFYVWPFPIALTWPTDAAVGSLSPGLCGGCHWDIVRDGLQGGGEMGCGLPSPDRQVR